ncbi:lipase family protein [Stieleria sp. TO1_6]|uniref:lipase family protein n=1 Tax=Stieleria tagensis TaxID=2956795 RepID=UPI00209B3AD9|nr:lipase family protein [Stieleria tagensis]MCO8125585.1 lipase family protein [Stieleria tagensis]
MCTRQTLSFIPLVFGLLLSGAVQGQSKTFYPLTFKKSPAPPVQEPAFNYFDATDQGSGINNRFLLAHLSMAAYNNTGLSEADYDAYLLAQYSLHGVLDVEPFHDAQTGADGAIFVTNDAVIVACRGTSGSLTNLADHYADLDKRVKLVKIGSREVGVHQGFWDAAFSVYPEVWSRVATEVASGRRLWLTGHSLGGATASMLAFRLQYMDNIPVQGLITYGAPRVGNDHFYKMAENPAAGGRALTESTQRFVLAGDVAATFWKDGLDSHGRKHTFHHFGITHTIFRNGNVYDFDYFSGELPMGYIPRTMIPWILTFGIHMEYEDALYQETTSLLLAVQDDEVYNAFNALPSN